MLTAKFDGFVREGASFDLAGAYGELHDGDMVFFVSPDGTGSGLNVSSDDEGLHSLITFSPWLHLRIGLEPLGNGTYAFRPAAHHIETWPALGCNGQGLKIE